MEDYETFHTRMVARNLELDREVLERVLQEEQRRKDSGKEKERQSGGERRKGEEEDEALKMAIALSLMEEEREKKEREEEKAELDYAIALSLALQAQDLPPPVPLSSAPSTDMTAVDLPFTRAAEEEKETLTVAPPTEAMAGLRVTDERSAPLSKRPVATAPVALGPLKGLRRSTPPASLPPSQPFASIPPAVSLTALPSPALLTSTASSAFTTEELKAKAEFLRQQRDLLLAQKQRKADEELRVFHQQMTEEQGQDEAQVAGPNGKTQSAEEVKRVAMQRVLRERLKVEAERTIGKRQEQRRVIVGE